MIHISPTFGDAFADWLNEQSAVPVKTATHNQPLPKFGTPGVILAPPDRHLVVKNRRFVLTNDPEVHSCRPSVDVLFQSVAEEIGRAHNWCSANGNGPRRSSRSSRDSQRRRNDIRPKRRDVRRVRNAARSNSVSAASRVLPLEEIAPALISLATTTEGEKT